MGMPAWPKVDGAQCLAVQDRGDRLITRKLDVGHSGERPSSTAVRVTRGQGGSSTFTKGRCETMRKVKNSSHAQSSSLSVPFPVT